MFAHAKLPTTFWAEAMMAMTYLTNKSLSAPFEGDTTQIVWTGKDMSYWYLKVFGCLAYVHVAKDKKQSWTPNPDHAYSLDTTMMSSDTKCETWSTRRSSGLR